MQRRNSRHALLLLLALLLAACGSSTAPENDPAPWQQVTLNADGVRLTFDVPAQWQRRAPQQWAPAAASSSRLGIQWADVPPGGSVEALLLPHNAHIRYVQQRDIGWTLAQWYKVYVLRDSTIYPVSTIEYHFIVEQEHQGIRRAYNLYVSAASEEHLDEIHPLVEHMLDTFTLHDSTPTP